MGIKKAQGLKISSRTHTCGELREKNIGEGIALCGWVQKTRDLGNLIFVDLRDIYGITQLVFDSKSHADSFAAAKKLKMEYVIKVKGIVRSRPEEALNKDLPTGAIEVLVDSIEILNESKTLPFMIENDVKASEELRFRYRYLDLRRSCLKENLIKRDLAMIAACTQTTSSISKPPTCSRALPKEQGITLCRAEFTRANFTPSPNPPSS